VEHVGKWKEVTVVFQVHERWKGVRGNWDELERVSVNKVEGKWKKELTLPFRATSILKGSQSLAPASP
jgi:hypothetical protein